MTPNASPWWQGRPPAPEPLPVPVVDNHTHLDIADREGGRPTLDDVLVALDAAAGAGVSNAVQIGCDLESARWTLRLLDEVGSHPRHQRTLLGGVSLHPNEAPRLAREHRLDDALNDLMAMLAHPRVAVVGETGLDYYRTPEAGRPAQHESFRAHIAMAKQHAKALQIHDRDAHEDVVRILLEEGSPERTVLHCFSGDADLARVCAANGWYLSFAGTVTFATAGGLREALAAVPLEQVLVETDAPFLTPTPHRGAPNASYLMPLTVRAIATVLDTDLVSVCQTLRDNSIRVYGPW